MYIDEWVYELLDLAERTGARRIVIDSLSDLMIAAGDERRLREWVYSLTQRCSRSGISLLMTLESPELFDIARISETGMSHLSDNVLLLEYVRNHSELDRMLTVLKTRASAHEPTIRGYDIGPTGIVLRERR